MTNQEFHHTAVVEVDMKRCFMPLEEGLRLGIEGFGELPVEGGHLLVPTANSMVEIALDHDIPVVTVGDAHPEETAHFSVNPDFVNTWPKHGIDGTPGSELHPELVTARDSRVMHFKKGDVVAQTPADDNSYSGALAHRINPETGIDELLPEYLRSHNITRVVNYGLTESEKRHLCLGTTALDLLSQGFEVAVVTDAVATLEPGPEAHDKCMQRLGKLGIELVTSHDIIAELAATPEVIER